MKEMINKNQKRAQIAYDVINHRKNKVSEEYKAFYKNFPSLVHQCGLCQALAFARSKKHNDYLEDLSKVVYCFEESNHNLLSKLEKEARENKIQSYIHLTKEVVDAAIWLKRYGDIFFKE